MPLDETLGAYARLVEQGKIRAIGASNYRGARLAEAIRISARQGWPRYQSLQPLYNLYDRAEYEKDLEPVCLAHQVGVITYFSLASGFLTGKYRSREDLTKSPRGARIGDCLNDRGFSILAALDQAAARHGATPAQVALAWLIARPSVIAPIASATSVAQLSELMQATRLTLDDEAIELLDIASR